MLDVKTIAELAHVGLDKEEIHALEEDMQEIVNFVSKIEKKQINLKLSEQDKSLLDSYNVFREDFQFDFDPKLLLGTDKGDGARIKRILG